ncbi:MAG TPA: SLC13 family permease [Mycobacterium sp.]|nr:SLC13 family permease [Mycobacterium sp.]HPX37879.1 SLC13 family permease [Mycobacterium sp.]HQC77634.1 SLC13 family permease [Mycobacterium sp.]HQE14791.1 SLC13 family permease [Mycobacterium sp.]
MPVAAAIIVLVALVLIVSGRAPAVLVLFSALLVAAVIGIATPDELFAGLSNAAVITIAAMLVIAKGVFVTGVISRLTYRLLSGVNSSSQALRRLIPPVGLLSSLINTTSIMAMLIPATKELEQRSGVPARGVLLPVTHATTLAGSVTLIGAGSNLLIAGIAEADDIHLSMFSFVPIALPVALAGWAVLLLTAPRLQRSQAAAPRRALTWRAEITLSDGADSIGRTPADLGIAATPEFELVEVRRWGAPVPTDSALAAGDVLIYRASEAGVRMLWGSSWLGLAPQDLYLVSIAADEGATLRELEDAGDIQVVAAETETPLSHTTAKPGALCLVSARSTDVLAAHPMVALCRQVAGQAPQPAKTGIALGILAAVVIAGSFGLSSVEVVAMAGAILMVLTDVLTPKAAVRALNWNILAIMAGSIGLGTIVVKSGLGELISSAIVTLSAGHPLLIVVVFAVITTLTTNLVTNSAAAGILAPVAIAVAASAELNPVVLLTLIGTCISMTFLNPIAQPTTLMVMGPGGYTTKTFVRFGIPLTVACIAVASAMGVALLAR